MATTKKANKTMRRKTESSGGCTIAHVGPKKSRDDLPSTINITISFEEALKLHLSLGQQLAKLNSYNRAMSPENRTAVMLRLYASQPRIAVYEGSLPKVST